jgi:hypothetical protein
MKRHLFWIGVCAAMTLLTASGDEATPKVSEQIDKALVKGGEAGDACSAAAPATQPDVPLAAASDDVHAGPVPQRITNDEFFQHVPVIHGRRIVWVDFRHNDREDLRKEYVLHSPSTTDLYVHDLAAGTTERLTSTATFKYTPQLSENYALWEEHKTLSDFTNTRVVAKDLRTGEERECPPGRLLPDDRLLFIRYSPDDAKGIWTLDLKTGKETLLRKQEAGIYKGMREPDLCGELLIWLQETWTAGKVDKEIHAWDQRTGKDFTIPDVGEMAFPRALGNAVAWWKAPGRLCIRDMAGRETVLDGGNNRGRIQFDGRFLTYTHHPSESYRAYDRTTGLTLRIKSPWSLRLDGPSVHNGKIVWGDHGDIYFADVQADRSVRD